MNQHGNASFDNVVKALQTYVEETINMKIDADKSLINNSRNPSQRNTNSLTYTIPNDQSFRNIKKLQNRVEDVEYQQQSQQYKKPFLSYHNGKYEGQSVYHDSYQTYLQGITPPKAQDKVKNEDPLELPNVKKMIHKAEYEKRAKSVRPSQKTHGKINLNINNYKLSFRQLGAFVVQQDHQFTRGLDSNYSTNLIAKEKQPTLHTIGKDLQYMDVSRTLMQNVEKLGDKVQIKQTSSSFYDKGSGQPMKMRELEEFRLENPMDRPSRNAQEGYRTIQPVVAVQKFQKTFDSSINDRDEAEFTKRYIQSEYSQMSKRTLPPLSEDQLLKNSYQSYNQQNLDVVRDYYIPQVREFEDMALVQRQREETEKSKNMKLLNHIIREIYYDQTQPLAAGFDKHASELQSLNEGIVKLDAEKLVPYHPLFRKLSLLTVKELLLYCILVRVKIGQTLYREGDLAKETSYLLLYGKFLLHHSRLGAIGVVTTGDSLGEEGLFERKGEGVPVYRQDMATAEEESFVLEFTQTSMEKVREQLMAKKLQMDWFTVQNQLKRQWVQKKSWRQFRQQEISLREVLL